jgi:hypothetical protein
MGVHSLTSMTKQHIKQVYKSTVILTAPPPINSPAQSGRVQEALRNQGFFVAVIRW